MPEQFTSEREEKIKSTIDGLRDRTPEEKAASLARGVDMLVEDLPENREFYDRMQGLTALKAAGFKEKSDRLHELSQQLYGPLGYDSRVDEEQNPN